LFCFAPFWFWLNGLFCAELICACLFVWGLFGVTKNCWYSWFGRVYLDGKVWQGNLAKKRWKELYDSILLAMIDLAPFRRTEKEPANYVCAERIVPSSWHSVLSATSPLARKSLCRKDCAIHSCHLVDIKRYEIIPLLHFAPAN